MKNRMLKRLVSWLLILSPLWWTCGCYNMREITKLEEANGHEIEVLAKGNVLYKFEHWTVDSLGTVSRVGWGKPSVGGKPFYFEGERSVPKDSIASMRAELLDVPQTVFVAALGIAAAVGLVWALVDLFSFHIEGPLFPPSVHE